MSGLAKRFRGMEMESFLFYKENRNYVGDGVLAEISRHCYSVAEINIEITLMSHNLDVH